MEPIYCLRNQRKLFANKRFTSFGVQPCANTWSRNLLGCCEGTFKKKTPLILRICLEGASKAYTKRKEATEGSARTPKATPPTFDRPAALHDVGSYKTLLSQIPLVSCIYPSMDRSICLSIWRSCLCTTVYIHIHIYIYANTYMHACVLRVCMHPCMHACMHTCITFQYSTLHFITLHYITLHCITLHNITVQYITVRHFTLHYITSHYITLHYITLHSLHCITSHSIHAYTHTYLHAYICICICIYTCVFRHKYTYIIFVECLNDEKSAA